jgi:N-acetylglucosamine malate deacetylase 2
VLTWDMAALSRKRAALACFASQRDTLALFDPTRELFRPAPVYDFSQPPHLGQLLYERYDWGMTGERWRAING